MYMHTYTFMYTQTYITAWHVMSDKSKIRQSISSEHQSNQFSF